MTIQVASVISLVLTGRLVDRLSLKMFDARVLIEMICLFLGIGAIVAVGMVSTVTAVIVAMVYFILCKGGYDGGIFASQFDYIEPHLRGSIVGLMNTFRWSCGALGVLILGAASTYGKGTVLDRMSIAISWSTRAF